MVRRFAPVERRDAPHGVDDVLVEAGEEPKSVLAGQRGARSSPRRRSASSCPLVSGAVIDHGNAAGLASGEVAALEDDDLEAALDQFVRGAHAGDAAA